MAQAAEKDKPGADPDPPGSDKGELKRLLRISQGGDPANIALAIDATGKAVIQADRRRQPRALEKELKDALPDARTVRFGTMGVDPANPKVVQFKINKAAGGVARKLVVALKGTGFNKVEISSDDGAPPEIHHEADEDEPEEQPQAKPAAPAARRIDTDIDTGKLVAELTPLVRRALKVADANPAQKAPLQKLATTAQTSLRKAMLSLEPDELKQTKSDIEALHKAVEDAEHAPPPAAPAQPAPAHDPKAPDPKKIEAHLTELARKAAPAMQAHPEHAKTFKTHLVAAHAALKGGDLAKAEEHAGMASQFLGMMGGGGMMGTPVFGAAPAEPPPKGDSHPHTEQFTKAAKEWETVMATVTKESEMVIGRVTKAFAEHGHRDHIVQQFEKGVRTAIVFGSPTLSLADQLYHLAKTHKDDLAKGVQNARAIVKHHIEHIAAHPILGELEHNPLAPVPLKQRLVTGLKDVMHLLSGY